MNYPLWLFGLSLLFLLLERWNPRRPQPLLRRGFGSDLIYLVFNGEYLGVLLGVLSLSVIQHFDTTLTALGWRDHFYMGLASNWNPILQFFVFLVVCDLAQWCVHNLLHRVPFLWKFHKVHHSIEQMDWIGNWRFHWFEVVIYRLAHYPIAAFFGFSGVAMFSYGIASTVAGHFAHSNLAVRIGPLKYLVNSPEMHIWHHTHPDAGPVNRNFAITLSVWDWLFGTAWAPKGPEPARLGFSGIEDYPKTVAAQMIAPLRPEKP